ncbi:MAG TPA: PrsW family glutamic-type intramembrane protease [Bacteroidales bacterium]|nr:PrsW family glutamic-type intramembrane protease [Bacteroidales bacterium]
MNIIAVLLIAVPLAIAPGIGLCLFIYFRDKFEKEPFKLLRNSFLFGVLSIIPAAIIELAFGAMGIDENQGVFITLVYAFLIVAVAEESCKFFVLKRYVYKKTDFNEPFDGIVYAVMISMGFATLENILYVVQSGIGTAVLRMFTAVPLHAVCAIFMGYFVGRAKFSTKKAGNLFMGLFIAVIIHGLYDFFLFQKDIPALWIFSFLTLAASIGLSFIAINKHRKISPFSGNKGIAASEDKDRVG